MPREVTIGAPKFAEGDRVKDRRGNVGFARWQQNRSSGEWFWSIRIAEGPDKAKVWGKAYDFAPMLDYEGGTIEVECTACDRRFLATGVEGHPEIPAQLYCRTHRNRDRAGEGYLGSDVWKIRHHSRESKKFETPLRRLTPDEIEEAKRQREEDEKGMPF